MTEKTLLVENPFNFQQDNKKFIQQLELLQEDDQPYDDLGDLPQGPRERLYKQPKKFGIIRALDEEAEKIAKAREEILLKDIQAGRGKGKQKSKSMKMWDISDYQPKKGIYKVKSLLKEKKETIGEFVNKKREIFLSNMNINNKMEETNRLEDFIKNEEESLKARKQYFNKDEELVKRFMSDIKAAAEKATKEAEKESKKKEDLKAEISKQLVQIDQSENKNQRLEDDIKLLNEYKNFVELARKNMEGMIEEKKKREQKNKRKTSKIKGQIEVQSHQQSQQQGGLLEPQGSQQNIYSKQNLQSETNLAGGEEAFLTQPQQQQQYMESSQQLTESNQNLDSQYQSKMPTQNNFIAENNLDQYNSSQQEELNQKYPGIDFEPSDLVDYLDQIEEKNLTYIHDKFEAEDALTAFKAKRDRLKKEKKNQDNINQIKKKELEKQKKQAERRRQELEDAKGINTDTVKFTEGAELKFEEINNRIEQIHAEMLRENVKNDKNNDKDGKDKEKIGGIKTQTFEQKDKINNKTIKIQKQEINSHMMKQKMTEIEIRLQQLTKETQIMNKTQPDLYKQVMKTVLLNIKKAKQQIEEERQLLEIQEKQLLRDQARLEALKKIRKGRMIMEKNVIDKREKVIQDLSDNDNSDDDEKYLSVNYEMGQDIKLKN